MRSAAQRRTGFANRGQSSLFDPTLTAVNARQKANHARHVGVAYPQQLTLRGILDAAGISGSAALAYEAFSAELCGIGLRFSGPAAAAAASVVSEKYADQGLVDATLCTIMSAAHGIVLPTPAIPVLLLPANGAPAEPRAGTLSWQAAAGATGYDVWLGPNVGPVIEVSHDQPGLAYNYAGLAALTLHDWYIIGRNTCGVGTKSITWQFTTAA